MRKIFCVFGLNLSGKSYFIKKVIIPSYRCLVIDVVKEYPKDQCDVYYLKGKIYPGVAEEIDNLLSWLVSSGKIKDYDLIIFDEAPRIFPNGRPLLSYMRGFLDIYRHHNIGLGFTARRPAQLFTDIPEVSHYIWTFGSKGSNDIQRLNDIAVGFGDMASQLSNYEYAILLTDRSYRRMPPI